MDGEKALSLPGLPPDVKIWRPWLANCAIWAAKMQADYGGYICRRTSVVGWRWRRGGRHHEAFWHHRIWSLNCQHWYEYTSLAEKPPYLLWWQLPRMLLFRGAPRLVTRPNP